MSNITQKMSQNPFQKEEKSKSSDCQPMQDVLNTSASGTEEERGNYKLEDRYIQLAPSSLNAWIWAQFF